MTVMFFSRRTLQEKLRLVSEPQGPRAFQRGETRIPKTTSPHSPPWVPPVVSFGGVGRGTEAPVWPLETHG